MNNAYSQAIQSVHARVKASRTSFGAGMAVLPKAKREAMYALYAFCREVDDIADDSPTREASQQGLQEWRERIHVLFTPSLAERPDYPPLAGGSDFSRSEAAHKDISSSREKSGEGSTFAGQQPLPEIARAISTLPQGEGNPDNVKSCSPIHCTSILQTLAIAIQLFPLIEQDFQDIIDGMAMDAGDPIVAPSCAELDLYCDRVASAVGRVSVRIFADCGDCGLRVAHHLGRALQLTNILRDVAEDAARGRLYLPVVLLTKHGIATRIPDEVVRHPNLPAVCRDLAIKARSHYFAADSCMRICGRRAMRPARLMRVYYGAILDKLEAEDWRDPFKRVTLPKWKKLWLVVTSFF